MPHQCAHWFAMTRLVASVLTIQPHRSTPRQGNKRSAPQGYLLRGTAADLIASNAPLRARRKSPWGKTVRTKYVRHPPKHYPRGFKGSANRSPAKAQRSGFGGERRSSGATELLPLKAKRRMWSLRRRGTPFSSIFLHAKKDVAVGDRWLSRAVGKIVELKMWPLPFAIKKPVETCVFFSFSWNKKYASIKP